jgi:hypothetical protein
MMSVTYIPVRHERGVSPCFCDECYRCKECFNSGIVWRTWPGAPLESFFGEEPSPAMREAYCYCDAGAHKMTWESDKTIGEAREILHEAWERDTGRI